MNAEARNPAEMEAFLDGAYRRIQAAIGPFTLAVMVPLVWLTGWLMGMGFAIGAVIAFFNFLWLKQSMIGLTSRYAGTDAEEPPPPPPHTFSLMLRFLLRYAAIALAAYVIIRGSPGSSFGIMLGLLMFVPALLCEVLYEMWFTMKYGD